MTTVQILTVILYAIGAFQGVVFGGILLASQKYNGRANRWLAILLLLLAYRLTVQILRLFGLGYYDTWYYFMLDMSWVVGPLLFFYVRALLEPDYRWRRSDYLHFLPLVFQMGFSLFVRLQNLYWDGTRESLSWLGYWGYVVWMNYSTIYVVASILIVYYAWRAQQLLKKERIDIRIEPNRIRWISRIIAAFRWLFTLVLTILLVDYLISLKIYGIDYWYFNRFYYYPFFASISLLTYWLGVEGIRRKDEQGWSKRPVVSAEQRERISDLAESLHALMIREKLFLEPDLSLAQLADRLEVKPYLLSNCLRDELQTKFSDYINELRVQEVERLMQEASHTHFSLLGLGMEAGFNSKSSFHRAIKRQRGVSPGELKERVLGEE